MMVVTKTYLKPLVTFISPTLIGILKEAYMKIKYYPDADALVMRVSDEKPDHGEQVG